MKGPPGLFPLTEIFAFMNFVDPPSWLAMTIEDGW
jgi:hypothetical protein